MLTKQQLYFLLDRLKWEHVLDVPDSDIMLVRKRRIGYSPIAEVAQIEATLSIMLEAKVKGRQ